MKRILYAATALALAGCALALAGCGAVPPDAELGATDETRGELVLAPLTRPTDTYVQVGGRKIHKSCVFHTSSVSTRIARKSPCRMAPIKSPSVKTTLLPGSGNDTIDGGWVGFQTAFKQNPNDLMAMLPVSIWESTFRVPPAPLEDADQLILIKSGAIEYADTDGNGGLDTITRAARVVLQWGWNGVYGGPFWTLTTWIEDDGNLIFLDPAVVSQGAYVIANGRAVVESAGSTARPSWTVNVDGRGSFYYEFPWTSKMGLMSSTFEYYNAYETRPRYPNTHFMTYTNSLYVVPPWCPGPATQPWWYCAAPLNADPIHWINIGNGGSIGMTSSGNGDGRITGFTW